MIISTMFKTALDKTKRCIRKIFREVKVFIKKKPKLFFIVISLFLIILLSFVIYSYLKPKPNDDIFFLNTNKEAILGSKNPSFNVAFGKRDQPDMQWVRFEAKSSSKNPFEEKKENIFTKISNWVKPKKEYGIEMSLQGVNLSETEKLEMSDSSDIVKSVAEIIGTDDIKTSTELVESGRVIGEYTEEPVSKKTVVNKEVADGVDLEYQILEGLGLKEEIVIRDLEAYTKDCGENLLECKLPLNEFVFDIKLDEGLKLKRNWVTIKGKSTENYHFEDEEGNYVAHFLPSWAIDSVGDKTYDVILDVEEKEDGNYRATVIVDINWLFSSDRVYPVRIDPSIVHDTQNLFDEGIFERTLSATGPKVQLDTATGYPSGIYTSSILDLSAESNIDSMSWTESGVHTGGGETPYSTTDLLAQWNFNETSGTTAVSGGTCGTSCNGTLTGMTTTGQDVARMTGWTSKYARWGGGAVMFDGSNDEILLGSQGSYKNQVFTIEGWIFPTGGMGANNTIFGFTNGSSYYGFILRINSSDKLNFLSLTSGGGVLDEVVGTTTILAGQWYHVTVTLDGSNIKLYLNGNLEGEDTSQQTLVYDTTHYPYIGKQAPRSGYLNYFDGTVDTFRYYTRALSYAEILSNYQSGNIEFQYRSSTDGSTWGDWMGGTEVSIDDMDDSAASWSVVGGSVLSDSNESILTMEGAGSLKIEGDYSSSNAKDYRVSRTITSTDITSYNKLPFHIASDKQGTNIEYMVGESSHANYLTDANTVGLWHLDESTGTGAYLLDSSGNGLHGTPTGTSSVTGKLGSARDLAGGTDRITIAHNAALNITTNLSIEAWINPDAIDTGGSWTRLVEKGVNNQYGFSVTSASGYGMIIRLYGTSTVTTYSYVVPPLGVWSHVAVTYDGSNVRFYLNGQLVSQSGNSGSISTTTNALVLGNWTDATRGLNGRMDEVRISNKTRTDEEIKQAYEFTKRKYQVTVDFKADLQSSNLIANSSDTSFTISETAYGSTDAIENLNKWDKIIVRENSGGTDYRAQGTVDSVDVDTGAVTVIEWDTGSTFPSGGYTTSADVFKWQEEFFDTRDILPNHINAVTNLTFRILTTEAANYWIDDMRAAKYLVQDDLTGGLYQTISTNTGWLSPISTGNNFNNWTNPTNAYSSNNTYATVTTDWDYFGAILSGDAGSSYSSSEMTGSSVAQGQVNEDIYLFGGSTSKWGTTWDTTDFTNSNFRVKLWADGSTLTDSGQDYYNFSIDIPEGATIDGIEVAVEMYVEADEGLGLKEGLFDKLLAYFKPRKVFAQLPPPPESLNQNWYIDHVQVKVYYTYDQLVETDNYFQYRAVFTTTDEDITPWISQVQVDYTPIVTGPTMDQIMRHGKWFGAGLRKNFWWTNSR